MVNAERFGERKYNAPFSVSWLTTCPIRCTTGSARRRSPV